MKQSIALLIALSLVSLALPLPSIAETEIRTIKFACKTSVAQKNLRSEVVIRVGQADSAGRRLVSKVSYRIDNPLKKPTRLFVGNYDGEVWYKAKAASDNKWHSQASNFYIKISSTTAMETVFSVNPQFIKCVDDRFHK